MHARDVDHAIDLANDREYGLGAALWTGDIDRARVLSRRIEAGAVFINGMTASDRRYPLGSLASTASANSSTPPRRDAFPRRRSGLIGNAADTTPPGLHSGIRPCRGRGFDPVIPPSCLVRWPLACWWRSAGAASVVGVGVGRDAHRPRRGCWDRCHPCAGRSTPADGGVHRPRAGLCGLDCADRCAVLPPCLRERSLRSQYCSFDGVLSKVASHRRDHQLRPSSSPLTGPQLFSGSGPEQRIRFLVADVQQSRAESSTRRAAWHHPELQVFSARWIPW
ncbi:aldehyde dehydrogenase family protein [Frigidibacter sp.]|uniref:aldehyde dehydrogenase family protein n=1 Tax=Frigidibacter sp. TaxID=2586418 RepID=UPI0035238D53